MDRELIRSYSLQTERQGELDEYEAMAQVEEPGCGDVMCFYIRTKRMIVTECTYTVTDTACPPLKACGARAAELAIGKPVMEAYLISAGELSAYFGGLPRESYHCAQMAELTLKKTLQNFAGSMTAPQPRREEG